MALQLRAFFSDVNIIDATEVNARYGGYLVLTDKIGQTDLLANFLFIVREVIALLLETGHLLVHANDDLANRAAARQQNVLA